MGMLEQRLAHGCVWGCRLVAVWACWSRLAVWTGMLEQVGCVDRHAGAGWLCGQACVQECRQWVEVVKALLAAGETHCDCRQA